jgi:hypothetical protein
MEIRDNSQDKKYFTIIPNYIANHSTANDQALYFQMKRLVGDEEKICYASEKYLKKQLKIGSKALKKSIKYLLEHGWIEHAGTRETMTEGGRQKINTYIVKDIWKMNMEYFQGVSKSEPLNSQGVLESNLRGVQKESKGVAFKQRRRTYKNNIKKELSINGKEINEIINNFKEINPSYKKFFNNKTQRSAVEKLLKNYGKEKVIRLISILPKTNQEQYAPTIISPLQLEDKLANLMLFLKKKEKDKPVII